jgi:hypothetical protein
MNTTAFCVRKDQLASTRLAQTQDQALADGEVRLRIEQFALTSNNITYAAFGDAMAYWQFFPAPEPGWGIVPVWGFATVLQSRHAGVTEGERFYGYLPMASSVLLTPQQATPSGFYDGAAHRQALHAVYNQYLRCDTDPLYRADTEAQQALLRPLFTTSWLIDDFLQDNGFFQARTLLLSSASSKTAYGTAYALAQRQGIEVVGLTSAANQAFCASLGCYSRVLTYDELDQVDAQAACVYVDFAGNAALRKAIHTRFANLAYSCSVGGTHVGELGGAKDLPGPRATLFFAPAQVKKRRADWGAQEFAERIAQAWHAFAAQVSDPAQPWIEPQWHRGPQAVGKAYALVLSGRLPPRLGLMLSLLEP